MNSYWAAAPKAAILTPALEKALAEVEDAPSQVPSSTWIHSALSKLEDFRNGLRKGTFEPYEAYVFAKIRLAVEAVIACKDIASLGALGLDDAMVVLPTALNAFATWETSSLLKQSLEDWFVSMKSSIVVDRMEKLARTLLLGMVIGMPWQTFSTSSKGSRSMRPSS